MNTIRSIRNNKEKGRKRKKLIRNMSDPIDYIDLTVDSPMALRTRSRNSENIFNNNSITTKSRKRNTKRVSNQLQDSVIEVPIENTCKDAQAMEVIDVDNISTSEQTEICCVNESSEGNLVVLTCPICYEQLSSKMKPMSTRCGHIFCSQCLELAMRTAKRCPTCKKAVKLQSCTRLYF